MPMFHGEFKKYYLNLTLSRINNQEIFISRSVLERVFSSGEVARVTNLCSDGEVIILDEIEDSPYFQTSIKLNIYEEETYEIPIRAEKAEYFLNDFSEAKEEFDRIFKRKNIN